MEAAPVMRMYAGFNLPQHALKAMSFCDDGLM
jgi:hypothetical protein